MVVKKTIGNGNDLVEIEVDYLKKEINMYNPRKRYRLVPTDLNFSLTPYFIFYILMSIPIIAISYFEGQYDIGLFLILFSQTIYLFTVLMTPLEKKLHEWEQRTFNDRLKQRKFMRVDNIGGKIWQLPYEFENIKLEYKLYGDYAKYIKKVNAKPKDYKIKRRTFTGREVIENPDKDWTAVFEWTKKPRRGEKHFMEIEWI